MSPYEWKVLEWDDKQTNKQSTIVKWYWPLPSSDMCSGHGLVVLMPYWWYIYIYIYIYIFLPSSIFNVCLLHYEHCSIEIQSWMPSLYNPNMLHAIKQMSNIPWRYEHN